MGIPWLEAMELQVSSALAMDKLEYDSYKGRVFIIHLPTTSLTQGEKAETAVARVRAVAAIVNFIFI